MAPVRRVLIAQWVTDFLQSILEQDPSFTVLIICMTRETFLEHLLAAIHLHTASGAGHHQLLTKTLGLLSKSSNVRTVFCPTLEHLRAYVSAGMRDKMPKVDDDGRQMSRPLLAIFNPLSLHQSTMEFSAQGLSRTLASVVEVSSGSNIDIVLCECRDALDSDSTESGEALWYVDVPLLSSSLRTGVDGNYWTGRAVPVKRVVQRWFQSTNLSESGQS